MAIFKNPVKVANRVKYQEYIESLDTDSLLSLKDYLEGLLWDYRFFYVGMTGSLETKVINPLSKCLLKGKEYCTSEVLKENLLKTLKIGYKSHKALKKIDKNPTSGISEYETNSLKDSIMLLHDKIYREDEDDCSSAYNACDQFIRRLINVPLTFLKTLFNQNKSEIPAIDNYFPYVEAIKVPDIMVGKKDESNNWIYKDSYEKYIRVFYETTKLISSQIWEK